MVIIASLLFFGCQGNDESADKFWKDVNLDAFKTLPLLENLDWNQIKSAEAVTYWELRQASSMVELGDTYTVIGATGNKCGAADDKARCLSEFDALRPLPPKGFGADCHPGFCFEYFVSNSGNENKVWNNIDALKAFLGPVDSGEEAALLVNANGFYWERDNKEAGAIRQAGEEYELIALKTVRDCAPVQTDRFLIRIDREGALGILREQVFTRMANACV